ncbi:MAG TPA: AI-2E family transporter [Anaerolineales bacterium]|nr:AI-2E family transporter [Anaerolineales bacterium]
MTTPPAPENPTSPAWNATTKLIVGLTLVGVVIALFIYFRGIVGPLLLAFLLAYVMHPLAVGFSRSTRLKWRSSVNLVYLFLVILVVGLLTLSGLAIVQQLTSLIRVLENFIETLPELVASLSTRTFALGPFQFSLGEFDLQSLANQLLGTLQTMLGRVGGLVSSFATSAATTLGWGAFVLLVSYFLLADAGQVSDEFIKIEIPGYQSDINRLLSELKAIWNAFLRGQLLIFLLTVLSYSALMSVLGVRYAIGIAILAGAARFIPYIGPLVVWIVIILVALLQGSNYFGLSSWWYAGLVLGSGVVLDQVFDNIITPRLMGQTLGVHPAAVLVAAIIAANLIGIIGLLLAAPVLATLKLLVGYIFNKMLDLDPWSASNPPLRQLEFPWVYGMRRARAWWRWNRRSR